MLSVILVTAAVTKVAWYVAGGLLATWAVVLSAFGLSRPNFPSDARGQWGVIAITAVIVVIAIAMAVISG